MSDAKNRRANAVMFGFDFQINAAIVLMLENILELRSLRLEGENEDIEIELNDGQYILAQAKATELGSSDFRNVRAKLEKALVTLSEATHKVNAKQLIFISNSFNPFNDPASQGIFSGPPSHRAYDTLPKSSQEIIDGYLEDIDQPLDKNKLLIQTLPFETDDDKERYKYIIQAVDDFVGGLSLNMPGMGKKLLTFWQNELDKNGSKRDPSNKLSKKDLIWPMLVITTEIEQADEDFLEKFDPDVYDEVVHLYKETIDTCCERFEFFIKILFDYSNFKSIGKPSEKCIEFAMNKWEDYRDEFAIPGIDDETQKALIQIVLYNVVKRRLKINRIKQGVNL